MNVIQTSARDINLTTRQATSTLANSQLVLVDGRSIYLDFFGLVLWDFVPSPTSGDIKQIEVVRGPASAVWGANALTGVVNIITKTPRENEGLGVTLSGGLLRPRRGARARRRAPGTSSAGSFSYANAINDTWSYRLSAGYFNSDPYSRPVGHDPARLPSPGAIPCRRRRAPRCPGASRSAAPPSPRTPTSRGLREPGHQPAEVRPAVRPGLQERRPHHLRGRLRGHRGDHPHRHRSLRHPERLLHGLRPKVGYTKGALRIDAFAQLPRRRGAEPPPHRPGHPAARSSSTSRPRPTTSRSGTRTCWAGKHILTYGGNLRRNNFDISLAPRAEDRTEFGAYCQEEFFVDKFRIAAGGRVDKFGNLDDPVFSPRVSVMFKPTPDHSIRGVLQPGVPSRRPSSTTTWTRTSEFPQVIDLTAAQAAPRAGGRPRPASPSS